MLNRVREGTNARHDVKTLLKCRKKNDNQVTGKQHIYPTKKKKKKKQCKTHNDEKLDHCSTHGLELYAIQAQDDAPDSEIPDDDTFCGGLPKK